MLVLITNYNIAMFDGYQESGSNSNMSVDSRTAKVLNSKFGIDSIYTFKKHYQVNVGYGLQTRIIDEDGIDANLAATNISFDSYNDNNVNSNYINIGFKAVNFKDLVLDANYNIRSGDGGEEQKTISLGVNYKF